MSSERRANDLPVVVIGAGPIGLAAAVHLLDRGLTPLVLEAGPTPGHGVVEWSHVRMFSPWRYNVDEAVSARLTANGWTPPEPDLIPTGAELLDRWIRPMADLPELRGRIRCWSQVTSITRLGFDKLKTSGRTDAPFELTVRGRDGERDRVLARAVIDASGTWSRPNPTGASGVPAVGEDRLETRVVRRIPDLSGRDRARHLGRRTLVIGGGDSAFNALIDLAALRDQDRSTSVVWAIRGEAPRYGGGSADQLPARGALGTAVAERVSDGAIELVSNFRTEVLREHGDALCVEGGGISIAADEVVSLTGFRPDLSILREVRLDVDETIECPRALAPLIDPNVHSCGTVPPHGFEQLRHPEDDLYIVGMKSYGRAPTFLLMTGYEQVRSVTAALAGHLDEARQVRLVLPETGVCGPLAAPVGQPGTAAGLPIGAPVGAPVGAPSGAPAAAPAAAPTADAAGSGCCADTGGCAC